MCFHLFPVAKGRMVLETLAEAILGNDKNDPSKMANRRMYGYQNCVKTWQALLVFYERCLEMLRNSFKVHPESLENRSSNRF